MKMRLIPEKNQSEYAKHMEEETSHVIGEGGKLR